MAKRRINEYKFIPGIPTTGNLYPNAWAQLNANFEFLKDEATAFIASRVTSDTAYDAYPNASARIVNNLNYIKAEVAKYVENQVAGNVAPFAGYTGLSANIKADVEAVVNAAYKDTRYGGNERLRTQSNTYYIDGVLQLGDQGNPEIQYLTYARTLIDTYILPGVANSTINTEGISQNTSGSNGEAAGRTLMKSNMDVIINAIDNGIITLPAEVISSYPFADYTYDSYLCERDMGYNLTGILKDLRYGGNEQSRYNAGTYWNGEVSVLTGNRQPEIQTKNDAE